MKHKPNKSAGGSTSRRQWVPPDLARQLRIVAAVSVSIAAVVSVFVSWDRLFPKAAERVVHVYRLHGCKCVFVWRESLAAQGFNVKLHEVTTLEHIRSSLHTPPMLHGCHLASYLGYFVEGHVNPIALHKLAREHPNGLGVVTQASLRTERESTSAIDESSPVLFLETDGHFKPWLTPES